MVELNLFDSSPYIDLPYHFLGWIGWFAMAAMLLWWLQKNRFNTKRPHFWLILAILLMGAVITNLFLGFNLPWEKTLPLPNIPRDSVTPEVVLFAGLPLLLAAGMLGAWPAVIVGFASGLISALWNTHSIFTPIETATLAYLLSLATRQNYRTLFYRVIRRPLGAALLIALLATPLYLISTFFGTNGSLAARLDYCLTQSWMLVVTNGIQFLIAGLICELFLLPRSNLWVQFKSFEPSPSESGLQARILSTSLPMIVVLLMTLSVADWAVAGQAAREMVKNQLEGTANAAAENIPYITETGQSLISDIISTGVPLDDKQKSYDYLKQKLRSAPFFRQLYLFDLTGTPLTGYPLTSSDQLFLSAEEQAGIQLALNGVQIQNYAVSSSSLDTSVQLSFLAAIPDEYGLSKGVLLARTDLTENLFSQPTIQALENLKNQGGEGVILDENGDILFDTNSTQVFTTYSGSIPQTAEFFDEASGTGTRRLVYSEPIDEKNWTILLSLPASAAQELALQIAIPLLILSLVFSVASYFMLRYMMRTVTFSLVALANQAGRITQGSLDRQVDSKGVDEIGRLGSAFEQMRVSLKDRLEELDRLLEVSQGVASNLSIEGASAHILKAALAYGASSARLVLLLNPAGGIESPTEVYADGARSADYAAMDKVLLDLLKEEKVLVIPSRTRLKRMGIPKGTTVPAEMIGASLRDDQAYLGILWVGYADPHRFLDGEIRFFNMLTNQVLLAVTISNLYLKAELGKRRLESVLASTPEPVLVIDAEGTLLTTNQAANDISGLLTNEFTDLFSEKTIGSNNLKTFIKTSQSNELIFKEIVLENGRTYLASLSPVDVEEKKVGKVCVLHDVTDYKALEKMRSDFVTTVSHDLRTPLSQLKGYASMLPMIGELNNQQKDYNEKILESLEKMSHMVDNLLDLGRLEAGIDLKLEKVSPLDLLDQVMSQLQPQATQRKVHLMKELTTAQELQIDADRALLEQALVNLLDNAIKFSPLNGQVNLRLQTNEKTVTFEIQDHGQGIAPLDLPNLFDRVQKTGRKDNQSSRNIGLGLAIVKTIAERHHARAWAESMLGKGSTFYLEVPIEQIEKKR